ncbi:MAG: hypothetical protein Q8919_05170, partial [Bacteroidota bacterium]|nr:hypothetical protein [Bacteroidota bacterium]
YFPSCELFDPATSTFTNTGSVNQPQVSRFEFDSTSGNIILFGGHIYGAGGTWFTETEVYNSATGIWNVVAHAQSAHDDVVQLPDGEFIAPSGSNGPVVSPLIGVQATPLIELFNPRTKQWRTLGNLPLPRVGPGVAYIGGDSVLVAGGLDPATGKSMNDCRIINVKTGVITQGPPLNMNRTTKFVTQALPDPNDPCFTLYRVYAIGGIGTLAGSVDVFDTTLSSCEMIEYRRGTQSQIALPNSLAFSGTTCIGIDTSVIISVTHACATIIIDSLTIEGFSNSTVKEKFPDTLADGSTKNIAVTLKSSNAGISSGLVHVYYEIGGRKLDTTISLTLNLLRSPDILSLPSSLVFSSRSCTGIDTSFSISDSSCSGLPIDSISIVGFANASVISSLPDTIASGVQKTFRIGLHDLNPGSSQGIIHIYFNRNGKEFDTTIAVTVQFQPPPEKLDIPSSLTFDGSVCTGIDTSFILSASTCNGIPLDSAILEGFSNAAIATALPDTIASGVQKKFRISFHDTIAGPAQGVVRVFYNVGGVEHDTTIIVTADLHPSNRQPIRLVIHDISDGGDTVEVPIYLASNSGDRAGSVQFTAHYNTDLLTPIDPEFMGTLTEGATIWDQNQIAGGMNLFLQQPFPISTSEPMLILKFKTAVTFAECTTLVIDNLQVSFDSTSFGIDPCPLSVLGDSATICRAYICGDETLREYMHGRLPEFRAYYDRPSDRIIFYDPIATSHEIEIANTLGVTVDRINSEGGNRFIDCRNLPAGMYIVRSSGVASQKIVIAR